MGSIGCGPLENIAERTRARIAPKECASGALVDPFCAFLLLYFICYAFWISPTKGTGLPLPTVGNTVERTLY